MSRPSPGYVRFEQHYLTLDGTTEQVRERVSAALLLAVGEPPSPASSGEPEQLTVDYGPSVTVVGAEGSGPPSCPRCATELRGWSPQGWFESGVEPTELCPECGFRAPVGDWDVTWIGYLQAAGALSLGEFPHLPEHRPELHAALMRAMGPRAAYVCVHL